MAARDVAERQRGPLGDVGLAPVCRAERHRHRVVEQDPADEHPLGQVDAHVRLAGACGDVPVDVADVVFPGHVRPHLGELGAAAEHVRAVVAREQAFHTANDC